MKPRLAITLTGALLILGCGATVSSSMAPDTNVSQFKTFSFHQSPSQAAQPKSIADQDIEDALKQSLLAKGYVEATNGNPDFLVAHHVKLQERTEVEGGYGYGYGYGWYGMGPMGVNTYTYTQGTLIVDFVDPKTNKAFWRGTASDLVNHPSSPNPNKIQAAVTKLINQYPSNVAVAPRTTM
jgi:hypothetical protein